MGRLYVERKKNRKDENDSCSECEIFTFPEKVYEECAGLTSTSEQKSCISNRESKHKRCGHARRSNLNVMWRENVHETKLIEWKWEKVDDGKRAWQSCFSDGRRFSGKKLKTCKSITHNHVSDNFLWLVQLPSNEAVESFDRVEAVDCRFSNFYSRHDAFVRVLEDQTKISIPYSKYCKMISNRLREFSTFCLNSF